MSRLSTKQRRAARRRRWWRERLAEGWRGGATGSPTEIVWTVSWWRVARHSIATPERRWFSLDAA